MSNQIPPNSVADLVKTTWDQVIADQGDVANDGIIGGFMTLIKSITEIEKITAAFGAKIANILQLFTASEKSQLEEDAKLIHDVPADDKTGLLAKYTNQYNMHQLLQTNAQVSCQSQQESVQHSVSSEATGAQNGYQQTTSFLQLFDTAINVIK